MVKCITFDFDAQNNLPQHIKDKMKADRERAGKELRWINSNIELIEKGQTVFIPAKDEEQGFLIFSKHKEYLRILQYSHSYHTQPTFPHGEIEIYQGVNLFI